MTTTNNPTKTASTQQEDKSTAAKVVKTTKSTAKTVAKKVADQAHAGAEAAKHGVADEVSGVASALRNAAEDMRNGSPQERSIGQIAESLADASDAIRDKDLGDVVRDISAVARRNPVLFLGGAAVLGFAATRFMKASRPAEPETVTFEPSHAQSRPNGPGSAPMAHPYEPRTGGVS